MSKKEEDYIAKLEKHADNLRSANFYSIQRIDLLIISICSAGIYASLEIMKYIMSSKFLKSAQITEFNLYFKITSLLFILSIITNFISPWTAHKGTFYSIESTKKEIYSTEHKTDLSSEIAYFDTYALKYNNVTMYTNFCSTLSMLIGLITLIISVWIIF